MTKNHVWRAKKESFRQLEDGSRNLEVRVGYDQIKKVRQGDTITFENYGDNLFCVDRIAVYDSFQRMLEVESVDLVMPGMTFAGALKKLCDIYPETSEAMGVYVFQLRKVGKIVTSGVDIWQASELLRRGQKKKFAKIVAEGYMLTDCLCKDYPNHCEHYFSKYVPGIYYNEREIFAAYDNNKIVGIAILKDELGEKKISTLYVREEYRKCDIDFQLLEKSFMWLGTTAPVFTISNNRIPEFKEVIQKFRWRKTSVMANNFYNTHSNEFVYNGDL